LAISIAQEFDGEIISADSLTVYKNMDIGTAKPTMAERAGVMHWGFDLIGPGQRFTAAQYKDYAKGKIAEIRKRGRLPMLVGGTGLYMNAVIYDYKFSPVGGERDPVNPRHLKRSAQMRQVKIMIPGVLIVGLLPSDDLLKEKIAKRVEAMFDTGLVDETQSLIKQYGAESLMAKAKVAYGPVIQYLWGEFTLPEAKDRLKIVHWQYARRQKTWFKRNPEIRWFDSADMAYEYLTKLP